jgi:hypothetical protein
MCNANYTQWRHVMHALPLHRLRVPDHRACIATWPRTCSSPQAQSLSRLHDARRHVRRGVRAWSEDVRMTRYGLFVSLETRHECGRERERGLYLQDVEEMSSQHRRFTQESEQISVPLCSRHQIARSQAMTPASKKSLPASTQPSGSVRKDRHMACSPSRRSHQIFQRVGSLRSCGAWLRRPSIAQWVNRLVPCLHAHLTFPWPFSYPRETAPGQSEHFMGVMVNYSWR